jgi:hypothetical protein
MPVEPYYEMNPEHFASVRDELAELFAAAHAESEFEQFPLQADYDKYDQLETLGMLQCYVMRKDEVAIGFGLYLVSPDLHHKQATFAQNDSIFLIPAERHGLLARAMVEAVDQDLRARCGVDMVLYHMRPGCSFTTLMKESGYHETGTIWAKG